MAGILNSVKGFGGGLLAKGQNIVDALFPPEKRAALLAKLQAFAVENPKLAAFLLSNIALTGLPLLMFITFTITVFVFSLIAALLIALLVALLFTVFMVGIALLVVLPTVFLTTMAASFIFLWGMGGYYILKYFGEPGSAPDGAAIGDKLNSMTGGRLDFLMQGAKGSVPKDHLHGGPNYKGEKESKSDKDERGSKSDKDEKGSKSEKQNPPNGEDSPAKETPKQPGSAKKEVKKSADGGTKNTDGVKNKTGGATGAAKSAASGAT